MSIESGSVIEYSHPGKIKPPTLRQRFAQTLAIASRVGETATELRARRVTLAGGAALGAGIAEMLAGRLTTAALLMVVSGVTFSLAEVIREGNNRWRYDQSRFFRSDLFHGLR